MQFPVMTKELALKIEGIDLQYTKSRLEGMQKAERNYLKIDIKRFGSSTAFLIQKWPRFWYGNRVLGLTPSDENHLDEIMKFFGERDINFRFEIIPSNLNGELASKLHKMGFYHTGFSAALYGIPKVVAGKPRDEVKVREARSDEIDLFLDLYQDGFGLKRLDRKEKRIVRSWYEQEMSKLGFYIAEVKRTPAAIAVFYVTNSIGLLADLTTLPRFRRKGCQTALINHQAAQAKKKGCDLLTSFVEFGSTSHRNFDRAGFRIAYTKAIWISG